MYQLQFDTELTEEYELVTCVRDGYPKRIVRQFVVPVKV